MVGVRGGLLLHNADLGGGRSLAAHGFVSVSHTKIMKFSLLMCPAAWEEPGESDEFTSNLALALARVSATLRITTTMTQYIRRNIAVSWVECVGY